MARSWPCDTVRGSCPSMAAVAKEAAVRNGLVENGLGAPKNSSAGHQDDGETTGDNLSAQEADNDVHYRMREINCSASRSRYCCALQEQFWKDKLSSRSRG